MPTKKPKKRGFNAIWVSGYKRGKKRVKSYWRLVAKPPRKPSRKVLRKRKPVSKPATKRKAKRKVARKRKPTSFARIVRERIGKKRPKSPRMESYRFYSGKKRRRKADGTVEDDPTQATLHVQYQLQPDKKNVDKVLSDYPDGKGQLVLQFVNEDGETEYRSGASAMDADDVIRYFDEMVNRYGKDVVGTVQDVYLNVWGSFDEMNKVAKVI